VGADQRHRRDGEHDTRADADLRQPRQRRDPPLDAQPRSRQRRQHGDRLQRVEGGNEPGHPLQRPALLRHTGHARPG
jgi:hypothetical protein